MTKWHIIAAVFAVGILFWGRGSYAQEAPLEVPPVIFPTSTPLPQKQLDEVIVVFKEPPKATTLLSVANTSSDVSFSRGVSSSNAVVFEVTSGDIQSAISELSSNPNVQNVVPNAPLQLMVIPNDPGITAAPQTGLPRQQWNMFNAQFAGEGESAWTKTQGSSDIVVAVVDTGIDSTHPDLTGKISTMADCSGTSCIQVTSMTDADTASGRGTHVAGLAAAATNNAIGMAGSGYNTKILPVKIMDANGDITVASLLNGLSWAADHGAKVINLSVGQLEENLDPVLISEINSKISYAWSKGTVIVAAAGNCGANTQGDPACALVDANGVPTDTYLTNSKMYPAASPNVLSVAALKLNGPTGDGVNNLSLTSYSQHNDPSDPTIGNWISVAAPGGDCTFSSIEDAYYCVVSSVPQGLLPTSVPPTPNPPPYFWNAGTSMASPHVAGLAALVWAANPNLSNAQVKSIIEESADSSVAHGATNHGAIHALAAVNAAIGGGGVPIVTPGPTRYPTTPPRLRNSQPIGSGPYCPSTSSCDKKKFGDANCDGSVDGTDFLVWLKQLDLIPPYNNTNDNSNFSCVEGNSQTYFADIVDYEVWRRNTTGGLVTPIPSGQPTTSPQPSPTPGGEPTPTNSPLAGCTVPAGECTVACVRVDWDRPNSPYRTDWTSSDVTIGFGSFLEFKPEPLSGMTLYVKNSENQIYRQCSDTLEAGEICPIHNSMGTEYGSTSKVKVFRYIGPWWEGENTSDCKDSLTLTLE